MCRISEAEPALRQSRGRHLHRCRARTDVELPLKSFPAWFWDYDNDGALDLFVSGYEWNVTDVAAEHFGLPARSTELDRVYRGDGRGGFRRSRVRDRHSPHHPTDGFQLRRHRQRRVSGLLSRTGYPAYEGLMPNRLFRNQAGERFLDVTTAAGVGHLQKGHGSPSRTSTTTATWICSSNLAERTQGMRTPTPCSRIRVSRIAGSR